MRLNSRRFNRIATMLWAATAVFLAGSALSAPSLLAFPAPGPPDATPGSGSSESTMEGPVRHTMDEQTAAGMYALQKGAVTGLAGPVDAATYRLGPGDLLLLQLWGAVSRSVPLEVGPEGSLLLPGAGSLQVDGRTLKDVREDIMRKVSTQFHGVNMDLRLARPRVFRVYLTGQVRTPGPIEATGSYRVGDVVTNAMLTDNASRRKIELKHRDGTTEIADLDLFFISGNSTLNPGLRDGDIIQVPSAVEFVSVMGAVARPGRFELGVRDSLITLLQLAGEPVPAAEIEKVLLIKFRDGFRAESTSLSLPDIYSRTANLSLSDGDRLYVYFVPEYHEQPEASIWGEIRRPGNYPITEGRTRLSQLVSAANGFRSTADLSAIRVHRRNPTSGEKDQELERLLRLSRNELTSSEYEQLRTRLAGLREDYRVSWSQVTRDSGLDLLIRDGDIVQVERLVLSVRVDGEVRHPGILAFVPGHSVDDYIREAGGLTNRAWGGKTRVTRVVSGHTLFSHDVAALDPGDFIWVPERPDPNRWRSTLEVLTALASLATIVIAVRSLR